MMTSDDDGWVDKSGAEGRSRRDEETRGNAEEYGGRGREDDGKCAWKRKCTRMNTAGGAREDDERDETSRARRIESSHHRTFATSGANLGEPIERGAPHSRFLFVRIDDNVEE